MADFEITAGLNLDTSDAQRKLNSLKSSIGKKGMFDMGGQMGQMASALQGVARQWLGIGAAVRMVKKSVSDVSKTIRELDKSITAIATVTNLSSSDLWGQMPQYTAMAKEFGVAINDVYKTSLLYYQQGMASNQVQEMAAETLKLSKIAGLDSAKAADYMTNAFRAFKMEIQDASQITDTYAALAANAATSVSEISEAMTKASVGAENVGISFKNTSAFITMMIETTRESASVIGSALSSMTARYSKLQKDPNVGIKEDGDNMSVTLNDVDKALSSIGIDMQDANGQIRDMDDVIVELAQKWDTLDKNTQSYVATLMAGARMKSKFQAMVGDYARLSELMETAENSENTAQLQLLKNMDSIETKQQQLQTAMQSLYTTIGIEKLTKGWLDFKTAIVNSFAELSSGAALGKIVTLFTTVSTLGLNIIRNLTNNFSSHGSIGGENWAKAAAQAIRAGKGDIVSAATEAGNEASGVLGGQGGKAGSKGLTWKNAGMIASFAGLGMQTLASTINTKGIDAGAGRVASGALNLGGGMLSMAGTGAMMAGPWGAAAGAVIGAAMNLKASIETWDYTTKEAISDLKEKEKETKDKAIVAQGEYSGLETAIKKLERLKEVRYESIEAMNEYKNYMNEMASTYPELISAYDAEGNAIINLSESYVKLAESAAIAAEKQRESAEAGYKKDLKIDDTYQKNLRIFNPDEIEEIDGSINEIIDAGDSASMADLFKAARSAIGYLGENKNKTIGTINEDIITKTDGMLSPNGNFSKFFNSLADAFENAGDTTGIADKIRNNWNNATVDEVNSWIDQFASLGVAIDGAVEQSKETLSQSIVSDIATRNMTGEDIISGKNIITKNKNIQIMLGEQVQRAYEAYAKEAGENALDMQSWANSLESEGGGERKVQDIIDEFNSSYENLTQKQKELFLNTINNLDTFTESGLEKAISEMGLGGTELEEEIKKQYKKRIGEIEESYKGFSEGFMNEYGARLKDSSYDISSLNIGGNIEVSPEYLDAVKEDYSQVGALIDAGYYEMAQRYYDDYSVIWSNISNTKSEVFSSQTMDALQGITAGADFTTIEGIEAARKSAKALLDSGKITDAEFEKYSHYLDLFKDDIKINTDAFLKSMTTNLASAKKAYDDMGGAVTQEKALENFKALQSAGLDKNINFSDIYKIDDDGKFVLTLMGNQERKRLLLEKYDNDNKAYVDELEKEQKTLDSFVSDSPSGAVNRIDAYNALKDAIIEGEKALDAMTEEELSDYAKSKGIDISNLNEVEAIKSAIKSQGKEKNAKVFNKKILSDAGFDENTQKVIQEAYAASDGTYIDFVKKLNERNDEVAKALLTNEEQMKMFEESIEKSERSNAFKQIDFDKIIDGTNKNIVDQMSYLQEYYRSIGVDNIEEMASNAMAAIKSGDISKLDENLIKDMSNEQLESVLQGRATNLKNAIEELSNGAGQVLDREQILIYSQAGILSNVAKFVNGKWVTKNLSANEIASAAEQLSSNVEALLKNNEISIKDANEQLVSIIEQQGAEEKSAFDFAKAASDGAIGLKDIESIATSFNMSVNEFIEQYSDILGERNLFTGEYENVDYSAIVSRLAEEQGITLEQAGEKYLEQLSSAADASIKNQENISKLTADQFKNLTSAKIGDKLNLTYLADALKDGATSKLKDIGIEYANGIGTVVDNIDLQRLKELITQAEDKSFIGDVEITNSLEELKDAITSALKNWANLLSSGLSGTLSNVDAKALKDQFNLNDNDFTETTDGLKLASRVAGDVYAKLKSTNELAAKIALKQFADDASKVESGLENIADVMSRINELEGSLGKASKARQQSIKNEISMLKDMEVAMRDNSDNYKLSDRKLPDGIQAGLNVWESGKDWLQALNKAKKSGEMGVQDFYNMVNFMGDYLVDGAIQFNGKAMTTDELLTAGMGALKQGANGMVVDLGNLGVDFKAGAGQMETGITDGIHTIAQSQVDMLDGLIAMLETIVAMEELGSLDSDGNNEIDLGELFPNITAEDSGKVIESIDDFDEDFEKIRNKLSKTAQNNEDLQNALAHTKTLGGISFGELLGINTETFEKVSDDEWQKNLEKANITYQQYRDFINGIYQAAISGDYDLENILSSSMSETAGLDAIYEKTNKDTHEIEALISFIDGKYKEINLTSEKNKPIYDNIINAAKAKGKSKDEVIKALEQYLSGQDVNWGEYGISSDVILQLTDEITVRTVDGEDKFYTSDEQEFGSAQEAAAHAVAIRGTENFKDKKAETELKNGTYVDKNGVKLFEYTSSSKITLKDGTEYTVYVDDDGNEIYDYNGQAFSSLDTLIDYVVKEKMKESQPSEGEEVNLGEQEYQTRYRMGLSGDKVHVEEGTDTGTREWQGMAEKLRGYSAQQIQHAIDNPNSNTETDISINNLLKGMHFSSEGSDEFTGENILEAIGAGDLVTQISTAIAEAFSGDSGAAIAQSLTTAFGNALAGTDGEGFPIDFSNIKIMIGEEGVNLDNVDTIKESIHQKIQEALDNGLEDFNLDINVLIGKVIPKGVNGETGENNSENKGFSSITASNPTNDTKDDLSKISESLKSGLAEIASKLQPSQGDTKKTGKKETSQTQAPATQKTGKSKTSTTEGGDSAGGIGTAAKAMSSIATSAQSAAESASSAFSSVDASAGASKVASAFNNVKIKVKEPAPVNVKVNKPADISLSGTVSVTVKVNTEGAPLVRGNVSGDFISGGMNGGTMKKTFAKGNIGSALAGGSSKTLMGELGPELVVSHGRYFTVGNGGPEFVDLASDAIVFNHLQTKKLLKNGEISSHGRPVTNERKATSMATGNTSGPAMSSASAALAALKQLRAMWAQLANASTKDLMGGGNGGGGGGGGGGEEMKRFLKDLDKWYNLEQQIERLEKSITLLEKQRANYTGITVGNGKEYAKSLDKSYEQIDKQLGKQKELNSAIKTYLDAKKKELETSVVGRFMQVDEDGSLLYNDDAFDFLSDWTKKANDDFTVKEKDKNGKKKSAEQMKKESDKIKKTTAPRQLEQFRQELIKRGASKASADAFMEAIKTDSDGTDISQDPLKMVERISELIDDTRDDYNEALNKYEDGLEKEQDLRKQQLDILNELRQKRVTYEEKLMTAYTDKIQAEIDALKENAEAIKKAGEEYIKGLNSSLEKEKKMYEKQESKSDLVKLQRQLAILQRTGGSASEIKSLQDQINGKLRDSYFEQQQDEIDATQEALDTQVEALQKQIDIQTEILEYSKANGLYWPKVTEMLETWSPEALAQYINDYSNKDKSDYAKQMEYENNEFDAEVVQSGKEYAQKYDQQLKDKGVDDETRQKAVSAFKTSWNNSTQTSFEERNKEAIAAGDASIQQSNAEAANAQANAEKRDEKGYTKQDYLNAMSALQWNSNGPYVKFNEPKSLWADATTEKNKKTVKAGTYKITAASISGTHYRLKLGSNGYMSDKNGMVAAYKLLAGLGVSMREDELKKAINARFKKGGMANFTGPAWLDGTKSKPEAVLTNDDYELLRGKIFSNSEGSLKSSIASITSLLEEGRKLYELTVAEDMHEASAGDVIFENVNLTIEGSPIANDYDAQRAGQSIMDEMMRIARKSGNLTLTRR